MYVYDSSPMVINWQRPVYEIACSFPDVIRIWDSLFADEKRFAFLIHLCCAMLM